MSKSASQIITVMVRPFNDAISKSMLDASSPHGFKIPQCLQMTKIIFRQDQVKLGGEKFT